MKTRSQLDSMFYPRSVALIGLPRDLKMGKLFLISLTDQHFKGKIFPVNPKTAEIDGYTSYKSVLDIEDKVDLAIIIVPNHRVVETVRECAAKGIKGIVLFTAGFRETATAEGIKAEEEFLEVARKNEMRIIGPNAMGLYCPESGISFFPQLPRKTGDAALISHSGSLANILCRIGPEKGIFFNKAVSVGNECDLSSSDFLDYFSADKDIRIIAAYLEGIRKHRTFLERLKIAAETKPVIIWKMGITEEGAKAASSHTGAMLTQPHIWKGIVRQTGIISVNGFEEWVDMIMGFYHYPPNPGKRIAIITGPGALGVSASEACGLNGLDLVQLSPETKRKLSAAIPETGTSVNNPVDIGLSASLDIPLYERALRITIEDDGVDAVFLIGIGLSDELNSTFVNSVISLKSETQKALTVVKIPGFGEQYTRELADAGIPVFDSAERAMFTYAQVGRYWARRMG